MQISKLFAKNLRFLRKAAGVASRGNSFSQNEIANFIGVSRKTLVFWESGHIPSDIMMGKLCEYFSRRLELEEPFLPEQLLNEDISEHFVIIPERGEVRKVTPTQKKLLNNLFARATNISEKDLNKIMEIIDKLEGQF